MIKWQSAHSTINGTCLKTESHRWQMGITKSVHVLTKQQMKNQVCLFCFTTTNSHSTFQREHSPENLNSVLVPDFSATNDSLSADSGSCLSFKATSSSSSLASTSSASGSCRESDPTTQPRGFMQQALKSLPSSSKILVQKKNSYPEISIALKNILAAHKTFLRKLRIFGVSFVISPSLTLVTTMIFNQMISYAMLLTGTNCHVCATIIRMLPVPAFHSRFLTGKPVKKNVS